MLGKAVFISAILTIGVVVINGLEQGPAQAAGFNKVAVPVLVIAWVATYLIWGYWGYISPENISPEKREEPSRLEQIVKQLEKPSREEPFDPPEPSGCCFFIAVVIALALAAAAGAIFLFVMLRHGSPMEPFITPEALAIFLGILFLFVCATRYFTRPDRPDRAWQLKLDLYDFLGSFRPAGCSGCCVVFLGLGVSVGAFFFFF